MNTVAILLGVICFIEAVVIVALVRSNKTLQGFLAESVRIGDEALKLAKDAQSDLKSLIASSRRFMCATLVNNFEVKVGPE